MTRKQWINQIDKEQALEIDKLLFAPSRKGAPLRGDLLRVVRNNLRFQGITQKDFNVAKAKHIISTPS